MFNIFGNELKILKRQKREMIQALKIGCDCYRFGTETKCTLCQVVDEIKKEDAVRLQFKGKFLYFVADNATALLVTILFLLALIYNFTHTSMGMLP